MGRDGFIMMEALLATLCTVLLIGTAGAYTLALLAEYRDAQQWAIARNLALEARERRVATGVAVGEVVQRSGVQYLVAWEGAQRWNEVLVARLKVRWHGIRGDRELSFIEPAPERRIPRE
ncbi:hypothetical protein CVV65_04935 [Kyrpidia spormannii]|uniref:Type II secretion system protein n=2 Tax=Kyrpidia spormannii TaxID=2055160 RepID=A0A2K8N6E2_9BACL|nr:hypothetical protein CVV65_04935 [Kyrpidia spormannii]